MKLGRMTLDFCFELDSDLVDLEIKTIFNLKINL